MSEMPPGRRRQMEIYVPGVGGAKPRVPVDPVKLEQRAAQAMSAAAEGYIIGGAGQRVHNARQPRRVRPGSARAARAA